MVAKKKRTKRNKSKKTKRKTTAKKRRRTKPKKVKKNNKGQPKMHEETHFWKKENILAGFFLIAIGLIWALAANNIFTLPFNEELLPYLVIVLGFIMALAGIKD